jgi:uncharacterized membrane protein
MTLVHVILALFMTNLAFAGHGAEGGPVTVLPHEFMAAVVVFSLIGLLLVVLGLVGVWLLVKIHRRLQRNDTERTKDPSRPA